MPNKLVKGAFDYFDPKERTDHLQNNEELQEAVQIVTRNIFSKLGGLPQSISDGVGTGIMLGYYLRVSEESPKEET